MPKAGSSPSRMEASWRWCTASCFCSSPAAAPGSLAWTKIKADLLRLPGSNMFTCCGLIADCCLETVRAFISLDHQGKHFYQITVQPNYQIHLPPPSHYPPTHRPTHGM